MSNTSPKTYSLITLFLVVACLISAYLVYDKYWTDYTLAKARKTNMETENDRLQKALQSSVTFLESYQNAAHNAEIVKMALPADNPDLANFINSFAQVATQSGVSLLTLQIGEKTTTVVPAENSIQSLELTIGLTGTYASFKDFMSNLENHLRIVDVYSVAMSGAGDAGTGTPGLEFTVNLRTYYQQ